jgi:hypothetical protein
VDPRETDVLAMADQHKVVCKGRYYEPRILYDSITLETSGASQQRFFDPNTFRNGEQWPLHVTHLVWAVRRRSAATTDERLLQRVGLRLHWHDSYYMQDVLAPVPSWLNVRTGLPAPYDAAVSVWNFLRPILLPTRGSMAVHVSLETALGVGVTRRVAVAFHGKGADTKQARELSSFIDAGPTADADQRITPSTDYSNDGSEEIIIESMTVNVLGQSDVSTDVGDVRAARIRIGMENGGTGADFTRTSGSSPAPGPRGCPASLLGLDGGRAVVHKIPRGGWVLHPGRGFRAEARNVSAGSQIEISMGVVGYVVVP